MPYTRPRRRCSSRLRRLRRARAPAGGRSRQRHEGVLAQSLEDGERRRGVAAVRDEVRASRRDRVRFAGAEPYFLLGIAEEEPDSPLQDIERVLDVAVIVPGDGLTWRDLQLGDPKTRT